ncbi:MAG TPA: ThuA domain-containing protein [Steroidobacteraceae bacterium]|nr:ThuA domain-containing protein [Steroidobacteraceae bacterium]
MGRVMLIAVTLMGVSLGALADTRKILFLAGPRDHGFPGRHEYPRDLKTLAESLEHSSNLKGVTTQLIVGSLPRDLAAVNDAAAIVIDSSSDRAADETHPLFPPNPGTNGRGYDDETTAYLKALDQLIKKNRIGVVIIHYASWVENWRARALYLDWTGGLWVQMVSRNPVDEWTMSLENRKHPVLRGVKPWTYRDEVFCRYFLPDDPRRTNLILATGKEDKTGIGPQIASWAYQRDDGGRAFVFGGLDFRDNLARDDFRRFLLNGIAWAAGLEVPRAGVASPTPDVQDVTARPLK